MANYYVTPTDYGLTQIAAAHDNDGLILKNLVLGDANGTPYIPIANKSRSTLVNQRASVAIQDVQLIGDVARISATVADDVGGFNIHEIGITDNTDQLIYIGNWHGAYKPNITEGAGGELEILIDIKAAQGASVLISAPFSDNIVKTTMEILTNNGLTGGGDLSQDRTIGIAGLNTTNGLTTKYLSQKGTWENLASDSTLSQFSVDLKPSTTIKQPIDNNSFYRAFNYDVRLTINQPSLVKMQSILESIYRQLMAKSTPDNVNRSLILDNLKAYNTNAGILAASNGLQFNSLPNAYNVTTSRLQDLLSRVGGFDIRTSNGSKPIELMTHFNSGLVNSINHVGNSSAKVFSGGTDYIYVPAGTTFDLNISLRFRLETGFYINEAIPYFRFDIIGLGGELAAAPTVSYGALGQGLTSFDASGDSTIYYPPAPIDFRVSFLDYTMNNPQNFFSYIETDANGVHRFNLVTPKLPRDPGVLADGYSGTIFFGSSQAGFIHGPSDTMTVKITSPDGAVVHTQVSSTNPATLGNSIQVYLKASSNGSSAQHSYAMQVFVSGVLKVSADFQPIQGWEISHIVMN